MTAKRIATYVAAVVLWGGSTYVAATAAVNSAVEEVATLPTSCTHSTAAASPAEDYLPPWER